MGALTLALVGEGAGDLGAEWPWTTPRSALSDDELGPAHLLIRRATAAGAGVPEGAVRFVAPVRKSTGAHYRGSDLLRPENLRRIVAAHQLPVAGHPLVHRVVVLVDQDGDPDRERMLVDAVGARAIVGVAVKEFEAWLHGHPNPESLARGQAKADLRDRAVREARARAVDLDELARRCPSFGRRRGALAVLRGLG